ncbi:SpoIID/LytB domain-containing protein [Tyzzerella sp. OttesenSCG-928-J15]|nr:SpoIID/LytB domain-containing protein [Tyzzerella sp. OttesenSCG-928-J15]
MAKGKFEYWLSEEGLDSISAWCGEGLSWKDIAQKMGISFQTLKKWKVKYPEIGKCLISKDEIDVQVENALLEKALDGSVTAQIFWLKNMKTGGEQRQEESGEAKVNTAYTGISAEKLFSPNEKFIINPENPITSRIYIKPLTGKIALSSINRDCGAPAYRGLIEISPTNGGYIIVNEISLEEYLYSVVPSEMPLSYGIEALKVQAVTARSYAYNQFYANTFHQYGANVCDSVISQVYNNIAESDISIQAVDETKGLCLTHDSAVISANFFSTSAGVTANNGEVWADSVTKKFPAQTSVYLQAKTHYQTADYGDLSIEENMAGFIKNKDIESYDSFTNWFRWYTEMTAEEISASINANLKERYEASPKLIKTLQADGVFRSRPVESIGNLVNIEVVKRGESGNIMALKIAGTQNTILVNTEYNIRTLLRPKQYTDSEKPVILTLADGKERENYSLMPSAFFAMERMTDGEGKILYVKFYGGGNGHGVGMSQTGVKGMVDKGKTFEEVLEHYYNGTVVEKMY